MIKTLKHKIMMVLPDSCIRKSQMWHSTCRDRQSYAVIPSLFLVSVHFIARLLILKPATASKMPALKMHSPVNCTIHVHFPLHKNYKCD